MDDFPVIPPPSSIDVDYDPVIVYDADGIPYRRRIGFTQPFDVVHTSSTSRPNVMNSLP